MQYNAGAQSQVQDFEFGNFAGAVRITPMIVGTEWLVEATGCDKIALRDEAVVRAVLSSAMADLGLKSVGSVWHKFEGEGGITGLVALTESHLACHTYPEHRTATFNLYCCRSRPEWDWENNLKNALAALDVTVTKIERGEIESHVTMRSQTAGGDA